MGTHATRSGKHAADNVSLRDLRIETADGHLSPRSTLARPTAHRASTENAVVRVGAAVAATSKDTSRAWASLNPQHPHHNTHTHPSPSAHNGRKTKARCNSSALSCNNDKWLDHN